MLRVTKLLLSFTLILAVALLLAACAGRATPEPAPETEAPATEAPAPAEPEPTEPPLVQVETEKVEIPSNIREFRQELKGMDRNGMENLR